MERGPKRVRRLVRRMDAVLQRDQWGLGAEASPAATPQHKAWIGVQVVERSPRAPRATPGRHPVRRKTGARRR